MRPAFRSTAFDAFDGALRVRLTVDGTWEALCGGTVIALGCITPEEAFDACADYLRTTPDNDVEF